MKYNVKVADQTYEVEIEDLNARPVLVRVDGQEFEVTPEGNSKPAVARTAPAHAPAARPAAASVPHAAGNDMLAPLPGTVTEVFVKSGEQVETGQVILIIEAMKMKNSIRSRRAGKIAEVLVNAGQTVAHKQVLVRFE